MTSPDSVLETANIETPVVLNPCGTPKKPPFDRSKWNREEKYAVKKKPYGLRGSPTRNAIRSVVSAMGEEHFVDIFCTQVAAGVRPEELCKQYKISWLSMRAWLEEEPGRIQVFDAAKRAYADKLVWDALKEVQEGNIDDVALRRLRSETFLKVAGMKDRKQYGQKMEVEVTQNISIIDALKEAHSRVEKLVTHEPLTLENELGTENH